MKFLFLCIFLALAIAHTDANRRRRQEYCSLPVIVGPCEALIPSWYFNTQLNRCEQFNYGGCGGNENRFETELACKTQCGLLKHACYLPAKVGKCRAAFQRWHYDAKKFKCARFIYGGCEGNANNFKTLNECKKKCFI